MCDKLIHQIPKVQHLRTAEFFFQNSNGHQNLEKLLNLCSTLALSSQYHRVLWLLRQYKDVKAPTKFSPLHLQAQSLIAHCLLESNEVSEALELLSSLLPSKNAVFAAALSYGDDSFINVCIINVFSIIFTPYFFLRCTHLFVFFVVLVLSALSRQTVRSHIINMQSR
jgi:hypothetical protein